MSYLLKDKATYSMRVEETQTPEPYPPKQVINMSQIVSSVNTGAVPSTKRRYLDSPKFHSIRVASAKFDKTESKDTSKLQEASFEKIPEPWDDTSPSRIKANYDIKSEVEQAVNPYDDIPTPPPKGGFTKKFSAIPTVRKPFPKQTIVRRLSASARRKRTVKEHEESDIKPHMTKIAFNRNDQRLDHQPYTTTNWRNSNTYTAKTSQQTTIYGRN